MSDPWAGSRCPIPGCPRQWPVESIRQQCLREHPESPEYVETSEEE